MNEAVHPQKLLFVCSRNRLRSLTAERLFDGFPPYQVRSVGTQPDARIVITEGHIGWADVIFVMEKSHLDRIRRRFPEALQDKRIVTLGIPDDYEFMQPELIDELRSRLDPHLTPPARLQRPTPGRIRTVRRPALEERQKASLTHGGHGIKVLFHFPQTAGAAFLGADLPIR